MLLVTMTYNIVSFTMLYHIKYNTHIHTHTHTHTQYPRGFLVFSFFTFSLHDTDTTYPFTLVLLSLIKYIEPGIFIICSEIKKTLLLRDK
jgi:hypothetical protein